MKKLNWPHRTNLKLFIDNCCSHKLAGKLNEFFQEDFERHSYSFEAVHLKEMFDPNEGDLSWLKKLEHDPEWVVLTRDLGRNNSKEKLPLICKELRRTHILISPSIGTYEDLKEAIAATWRLIRIIPLFPKGSEVRLKYMKYTEFNTPVLEIEKTRLIPYAKKIGIDLV